MKNIYLDNGATSFPKAPGVAESMSHYLLNVGCNVNRGAYDSSLEAENIVYETRELLCELFNFNKPENAVFTKNITESLNVVLKTLLKRGDHVIVSSMEHNAVMRPLGSLAEKGVKFSKVPCNIAGQLNPEDIKDYIKPNTRAVVMTHGSNVSGTMIDIEKVGEICKENNIYFIVDTAQTAGFADIDFEKVNADIIAFTGHKSLLGPQGTGGFLVGEEILKDMSTFIEGGTGSASEIEIQPNYMPDKFEAGTMNIPGIYGLNAALKYISKGKIKEIREKELYLIDAFLKDIYNIDGIRPVGLSSIEGRTAVVSIDFLENDNALVAHSLNEDYGIMTRCGLHCAPSAHKTLDTFPQGTVRFGFSHFTTMEEVKYTIDSINSVVKKAAMLR
jgi:cysteine desulfurase family protein